MADTEPRLRILMREDSAVFTWTQALAAARPDLRPGWQYRDADGTFRIELDKVSSHVLENTPITERERRLIEENARLHAQLEASQGLRHDALTPWEVAPEPGESQIPPPPPIDEIPVVGKQGAYANVPPSVMKRWGAPRLVQEITARGGGSQITDAEDIEALRDLFTRLQEEAK